ncbi:MAG: filamentous hemagglutinin N-terminal domain-containing protein, partial [Selenomonas sp.]|nr:filamentous hemagglutinin N-terminal domain-containing protein [Selenomonas sp.]
MKRYHHIKKATLAAMVALALSSTGVFAADLPAGGEVKAGTVTVGGQALSTNINPETGTTFNVDGNSVIDWTSFDIGSGKSLSFVGNSSNFLLNRVTGGSASEIYGTLNTQNLHFILANPNGITVDKGAVLNGSDILLAATTSQMLDNERIILNTKSNTSNSVYIGNATIEGNVTAVGRTINVADGISFTGDSALKLLAGTNNNWGNIITPGEDFTSVGSGGEITFSGSLNNVTNKVTLGASADTVSMGTGKTIELTGTDSSVNIRTASLK